MRKTLIPFVTVAVLALAGCSAGDNEVAPVETVSASTAPEPSDTPASDDPTSVLPTEKEEEVSTPEPMPTESSVLRVNDYYNERVFGDIAIEEEYVTNTQVDINGWGMELVSAGFNERIPNNVENESFETYPELAPPSEDEIFFIYKIAQREVTDNSLSSLKVNLNIDGVDKGEIVFPTYDGSLVQVVAVPRNTQFLRLDFILDDVTQSYNALTGERM